MKKKLRIGGIVLISILLLGGAYMIKHRQDLKKAEQASKALLCSTGDLGKEVKLSLAGLNGSSASFYKPLAEKIEALNDYEESANCIYVLTAYNAYIGNYPKAKSYYANLQTLKAKGINADEDFKVQIEKLDKYMAKVDEIEKQYKASTFRGGPGLIDPKVGTNGQ